jgi:hypothetical protein
MPPWPSAVPVHPCRPSPCPAVAVATYSGNFIDYAVPAVVSALFVELSGASGGACDPPVPGAYVQGIFDVVPGEVLQLLVGGAGGG